MKKIFYWILIRRGTEIILNWWRHPGW